MTSRQTAPEILTKNKIFRQTENSKGRFKNRDNYVRRLVWTQFRPEIPVLQGEMITGRLGKREELWATAEMSTATQTWEHSRNLVVSPYRLSPRERSWDGLRSTV